MVVKRLSGLKPSVREALIRKMSDEDLEIMARSKMGEEYQINEIRMLRKYGFIK